VNEKNTDKYPPVGGVIVGDNTNNGSVKGSQRTDVGGQKAADGGEKGKGDAFGLGLPPAVEKVAGWPGLFVRNLEPSKGISIGFNREGSDQWVG
jgi:hypothetical protein